MLTVDTPSCLLSLACSKFMDGYVNKITEAGDLDGNFFFAKTHKYLLIYILNS